jgi:hypothetical protein
LLRSLPGRETEVTESSQGDRKVVTASSQPLNLR